MLLKKFLVNILTVFKLKITIQNLEEPITYLTNN